MPKIDNRLKEVDFPNIVREKRDRFFSIGKIRWVNYWRKCVRQNKTYTALSYS